MNLGVVSPWVLSRKALVCLLRTDPNLSVVFETDHALGEFESMRASRPDVLLIEISNAEGDLEGASKLRKLFPQIKILLLGEAVDEDFELRAIKAGAWGCLSKQSDPETLRKAIRALGNGEMWMSHHMATLIIRKSMRPKDALREDSSELTPREWEILALVAGGCQNKEIASRLLISSNTIKAHLSAIYKKLQVRTRMGAAMYYFQQTRQRSLQPVRSAASAPARTFPNASRS